MFRGRFRGFEVSHAPPGIGLVRFNEPERLNGTTPAVKRDLTEALIHLQMIGT